MLERKPCNGFNLAGLFVCRDRMSARDRHSHGWDDTELAHRWPPLATGEVEAVLAGFPALRRSARIVWHSPRPFAAAARVETAAGEVFVKRHHLRVRTPQALQEEHAFIAHLRAGGLPVPQVLADAEGRTTHVHGDWLFEVHAPAAGMDLYRDAVSWTPLTRLDHARSAGRMLARLHRAAAGFTLPARSAQMLVARDDLLRAPDLAAAIEVQSTLRPALADWLAGRDWRGELASISARHHLLQPQLVDLPRLWTHGDWHASNLFWRDQGDDAEVACVLDFGLCAPTFALYDLALAIERNAIDWLHDQRAYPDTARALIAGYAELLPLSARERHLLADLLPLVHLDYALSEVDYAHGVLASDSAADHAWRGYLLGHAAWFGSAPAALLLDAIRHDA